MSTSLKLDSLSRHFGGLKVLQDVNLEIPQGGIFGLIGPNGAGKTTVFNVITGLLPPTSGDITLNGATLLGRKPHAITFTSSSTVKNFVALLGLRNARAALKKPAPNHGVHSASIGPVTSEALGEYGIPVSMEPTHPKMGFLVREAAEFKSAI